MIRSLWTASTGMSAQQTNMDVISNNLANANTTGYKRSRGNFEDLMYQTIVPAGAETADNTRIVSGIQVGMGAKTISVDKVFAQGNFSETQNQYDMAIEGKGFFKVLRGDQEVYTRSGNFKLDAEGFVCDNQGSRLQPEISIPSNAVTVNIDQGGTLTALDANGTSVATGTVQLYSFANPNGLTSVGHNYFTPTDAAGDVQEGQPGTDGFGTLLQGYLESSNINVVDEMVNMIVSQRAYEANSKVIKTADEMLHMANSIKA
ncbi:MAG: flagellar basal-body rod protein FlgG [Acidobacteriota bacterium]